MTTEGSPTMTTPKPLTPHPEFAYCSCDSFSEHRDAVYPVGPIDALPTPTPAEPDPEDQTADWEVEQAMRAEYPTPAEPVCPHCGADDADPEAVAWCKSLGPRPEPDVKFLTNAATAMRERFDHGAAKFGRYSWREDPYSDTDNLERLRRAVAHLEAARQNSDDPAEWRKRAADVANQAFMFADPERAQ